MPSVRALTRVLDAVFLLEDPDCDKALLEDCLSSPPRAINPMSVPPEWEYGRLKQCSEKSECSPKFNTWSRRHQNKWEGKVVGKARKAATNFNKLANAYEKAYFQFAQRNNQNFGTIAAKYMESEKARALAYGCNQSCVDRCFQNFNTYAQCTEMSVAMYPRW